MSHPPGGGNASKTAIFSAHYKNLRPIVEFVTKAGRRVGLSEKAIYAVQLAIDEACANIIEHAYGGECDEDIECTCVTQPDRLTIILRDHGQPFDPSSVPDPDIHSVIEGRLIGGLGLYFIRHLMDEAIFEFASDIDGADASNVLTMVKRKEKTA